jgi:hypothetical protein
MTSSTHPTKASYGKRQSGRREKGCLAEDNSHILCCCLLAFIDVLSVIGQRVVPGVMVPFKTALVRSLLWRVLGLNAVLIAQTVLLTTASNCSGGSSLSGNWHN